MKNPTILKGELSLLRADKSAVITELRKSSTLLKKEKEAINELELKREGVRIEILEEVARLDKLKSRAIFVRDELKELTQSLKNRENQDEVSSVRSAQERKLHLGRIKDLNEQEEEVIGEVSRLKSLYDKNSATFNKHESERMVKLRALDAELLNKSSELFKVELSLEKRTEEEYKLTKSRLKREDKIRLREKNLDAKEVSLGKREEDLITMSKDMTIVYGRLKEMYSREHPDVNLDKLILNAL